MNKIQRRLKRRYNEFAKHPLTREKKFAALWRYVHFHLMMHFKERIVYQWIGNLKYVARKGEAGIVGNIYYGLYEFEESVFLIHLLQKDDFFLDIGANVGHYSLLMSGLKQAKSLAIEPVPNTYSKLREHISLNHLEDLIETKNIGVSNENGLLYFSTDRGTMDRIVDVSYTNSVSVEVKTIDSILSDLVPLALKIDVEGYEKYALEGAETMLNNPAFKVLILELNNSGKVYKIEDQDIFESVISYGFKPYRYDPTSRILREMASYNRDQFNTIFIRDLEFVTERIANSEMIKINNYNF